MDKVIIAAGFLLIVFALYRTIRRFTGRPGSCCGGPEAVSVSAVEDTDVSHYPFRYRLSVGGMKCSNCAKNVENLLDSLPGVWAKVDLGKKEADVLTKEAVPAERFESALREKSYTLEGFREISGPDRP